MGRCEVRVSIKTNYRNRLRDGARMILWRDTFSDAGGFQFREAMDWRTGAWEQVPEGSYPPDYCVREWSTGTVTIHDGSKRAERERAAWIAGRKPSGRMRG